MLHMQRALHPLLCVLLSGAARYPSVFEYAHCFLAAFVPSLFGSGEDPGAPSKLVPDAEPEPKVRWGQEKPVEQQHASHTVH